MDPKSVRVLKLRTGGKPTAAKWTITASGGFNPFHIHVNPFQVDRMEPNVAGAIVGYAERVDAGLVVVGRHGGSGFAQLTLGSTATSVIDSAPCSVLVNRVGAPPSLRVELDAGQARMP